MSVPKSGAYAGVNMMRALAVALALALVSTLLVSSPATARPKDDDQASGFPVVERIERDDDGVTVWFEGDDDPVRWEPKVVAVDEGRPATDEGVVTPMWTVGVGRGIYLYLNNGDVQWLRGLGFTAASAVICAMVATTVLGGVACAVVAYAVWSVIAAYTRPIPSGRCLEIRLNYTGTLNSSRLVTRNC